MNESTQYWSGSRTGLISGSFVQCRHRRMAATSSPAPSSAVRTGTA
ncbi:MAG: hypothetical protein BWZ02_03086 [Lentisphaerae bacterium ADurb.BinA184]|nr:MAG: hypothetical protein BWZ02_03086 [Lentisphaerae bacterium ADurb.BinA184]